MAIIVVHSLSVLEESDSTTSNAGLGHAWLLKSQVLLAKIDREEEITASDLRSQKHELTGELLVLVSHVNCHFIHGSL